MRTAMYYKARKITRAAIAHILLTCAVVLVMFPVFLIASTSFQDPLEILSWPPRIIPRLTTANFQTLLERWPGFFDALKNSTIIAVVSTVLALAISAPAAYVYSRYKGKFLRVSAFLILAVRILPPIIITIPLFPVLHIIGLFDRHITLAFLYAVFFVSLLTWLMKAFIDTVPIELEEAALIDGCNKTQAFIKITLPLVIPGILSSAIFVIIFSWNEFLFAFLFTGLRSRTAPIVISEMIGAFLGVDVGALFAASMVQLVPILILVWLGQKLLVKGMTMGAVKG